MLSTLRQLLVYAHLIGFALLLGGAVAQYFSGQIRINSSMLWGSVVQLVTGLALVAVWQADPDLQPDNAKIAVKTVVALAIVAMTFFSRRRPSVNTGHFLAIVALTLLNAGIAVFWR
jgi:hypothetical protein